MHVYARRPVIHYKKALAEEWNATFAIESPVVAFDNSADPNATLRTRMPDLGGTHRWNDQWRSTTTFGYARIDNVMGQAGGSFHASRYWSINLIHQVGPRLSLGVEALQGWHGVIGGRDGSAFHLQFSMVYSIF